MKKSKQLLAMGLIAVSIYTFAGCSNTTNPSISSSDSHISDTITDTVTDPSIDTSVDTSVDTNLPDDPVDERIPVEKVNAFISSLKDNYTILGTVARESVEIRYDGNKAYLKQNGEEKYSTLEDGTLYSYTNIDGTWHKNFDENSDWNVNLSSMIANNLNTVEWTEYDSDSNTFRGKGNVGDVSVTLGANGAQIVFPTERANVVNVSETTVTLPEKVIDDTIVSEKIYTIDENGNYDFNIPLLHEIFDDWFKGNNQWGKDAVAYMMNISNTYYTKIAFIDISKDKCELGIVHEQKGKTYLRPFRIIDNNFFAAISDNTISTEKEFSEYLNSVTWREFDRTIGIQIDTTMNQEDFDKMTVNIFNRLAEVGYQGRDITNEGTKVEGLSPENIVFSFASTGDIVSAGCGLGYKTEWDQYYLIEVDGQCKWIMTSIAASDSIYGEKYFVVEDTPDCWFVTTYEEKMLNEGNLSIHENNENTAESIKEF